MLVEAGCAGIPARPRLAPVARLALGAPCCRGAGIV